MVMPSVVRVLGGLISSTLLDFFVHPALFWVFGRRQAEQNIHDTEGPDELDAEFVTAAH